MSEQQLPAPGGLARRLWQAASWLLAGNLASQGLRLVSSMLLTRLLMPEAFGLMAAVNVFYFGLVMFADIGIGQSVIRSRHGDDVRFLGTAWVVQVLRGAVLAVLVLLLALAVWLGGRFAVFSPGTVYTDPELPWLIAAFALSALMQGFESIKLATTQRSIQARQMVRLELSVQVLTIAITLLAAWISASVWALLFGAVASTAIRVLLSYVMLPGRTPRPCWDACHAREIIGFGKWVFLSSVIGFLASQGEKLILGGTLGVGLFGIYAIASNLFSAVVGVYGNIHGRVIFPGLSAVTRRNDPAAMAAAYARVQRIADLILGFATGFLAMSGQWIVDLMYDSRYQSAGWMLQILGIGLLGMRYQILEQLMFALNHPGRVTANNILRTLCLLAFIPLGFHFWGETGAIAAIAASQFASWPLSLIYKRQHKLLDIASEFWWLPALLAGAASATLLTRIIVSPG